MMEITFIRIIILNYVLLRPKVQQIPKKTFTKPENCDNINQNADSNFLYAVSVILKMLFALTRVCILCAVSAALFYFCIYKYKKV